MSLRPRSKQPRYQPSGPLDELVRLDLALDELVLVLLVVLELEHPVRLDRLVDGADHRGVVAPGAISRPSSEGSWPSAATIFSRARLQAGLRQVVAEQVDRGDQRLRLERQQARRAGEVVAVGVGVDLDPVADDLGVEDVGAAAEVDDVEHVEVLAQLLDARC